MVDQMEPPPPAQPVEAADVAAEIAGMVEREPLDRVTCRRIHGNFYRCNWWAPSSLKDFDNPSMGGLTVTTHRVRTSAFVHAARGKTGLKIRVV